MKHILGKTLVASVSAALLFSSCSKKLDEAYVNPNSPTVVPIENIFPGLIGNILGSSSAAGSSYGLGGDAINIGRYVQYWNNYTLTTADNGATQFDQMGGTIGSSDVMGSVWAMYYYGHGQNLNKVVEWGSQQEKWDYVGAALALRAWGMLVMVNQYNNIILREAFNTSRQTFDYDDPQETYDSVRSVCYQALTFLNRTDGKVSAQNLAIGDQYFNGGDINKWKKLVYGVLARSFESISNKKSMYVADSVIKYCDLSMTANTDNAMCKFFGTSAGQSGNNNYFGPYRANAGSLRQSAFIADLLSGRNAGVFTGVADPRAWYLIRENSDSTFYGVTPAVEGTQSLTTNQRPLNFWGNGFSSTGAPAVDGGRYIFRDTAQYPVMTASEIQFLKAEAAYLKGDKATALAAYVNGISLSFDLLATQYDFNVPANHKITASSKADYLANPLVVPASAGDLTLAQIMMQKYIALYGWGAHETWVDMRKYHYTDQVDGKAVYPGFAPANNNYYINNNGKPVYRTRPRYNSEYLYDVPALTKIGALDLNYHTKEAWFSLAQ